MARRRDRPCRLRRLHGGTRGGDPPAAPQLDLSAAPCGAPGDVRPCAARAPRGYEPVPLPAITDETRKLASSLAHGIKRGPLLAPPSKWNPALIQRELARIELELELEERVRLEDLNARLKRLGFTGDLKPVTRTSSPAAGFSDGRAAGEIIGGGIIRRPNIGRVLGVDI